MPLRFLALLFASLYLPSLDIKAGEPKVYTKEFLSPAYRVDQVYKSMTGPSSIKPIQLRDGPNELLWITGYRAYALDEDGETALPDGFVCHSNLDMNTQSHAALVGWSRNDGMRRLFTVSQGQADVQFPKGFGMPFFSEETLHVNTQALNLNLSEPDMKIRIKVEISYVRELELSKPMKPLRLRYAQGMVLTKGDDGYFQLLNPTEEEHGQGCGIGEAASDRRINDIFGREFSPHWVVPPGRQVSYTPVTHLMNLPYDTSVHHIAVHVHPFAESVELVDLTTGESVFKSHAINTEGKIGLIEVDSFSSEEGTWLYKDHEYELVSVYNNTSAEAVDSMAVLFMYVLDIEAMMNGIGLESGLERRKQSAGR